MMVERAVCPCSWPTDLLEFSAIRLESALATTLESISGVAYLTREVISPVDSRTARTSTGDGLLDLTTSAWSLRTLHEAIL